MQRTKTWWLLLVFVAIPIMGSLLLTADAHHPDDCFIMPNFVVTSFTGGYYKSVNLRTGGITQYPVKVPSAIGVLDVVAIDHQSVFFQAAHKDARLLYFSPNRGKNATDLGFSSGYRDMPVAVSPRRNYVAVIYMPWKSRGRKMVIVLYHQNPFYKVNQIGFPRTSLDLFELDDQANITLMEWEGSNQWAIVQYSLKNSGKILKRVELPKGDWRKFGDKCIRRDDEFELYEGNRKRWEYQIYDLSTRKVQTVFDTPGTSLLSNDDKQLLVLNYNKGTISITNLETKKHRLINIDKSIMNYYFVYYKDNMTQRNGILYFLGEKAMVSLNLATGKVRKKNYQ